MTIQEKILNQLPIDVKNSLISKQLSWASQILLRENKVIKSYTLTTIEVDKVSPSQYDEDYNNASSGYDAAVYKEVFNGLKGPDNVRIESFLPIVVNHSNLKIIDGNHRHFAINSIGEKLIYAILCDVVEK